MWPNSIPILIPTVLGGGSVSPSLLPFTDDFTRADGDLANDWIYTAGKWAISSEKVVSDPTIGPELVINGDFSSTSGWSLNSGVTIGSGVCTFSGVNASAHAQRPNILTIGQWYRFQYDINSLAAGGMGNRCGLIGAPVTGTGTKSDSLLATGDDCNYEAAVTTTTSEIDNASCKQITYADIFALREFEEDDVDIQIGLTANHHWAGLIMCADAVTNPSSYLIAWHDGVYANLFKCVSGTYTQIIRTVTAYIAGAELRLYKNGTTVKLIYNSSQVGTDQTVSDAEIVNNTKHGMFNTYNMSTVDYFHIQQAAPFSIYWEKLRDLDISNSIAFWRLNETSGTQATDTLGSRHGTYTGGPSLANAPGPDGVLVPYFNGTQYIDITFFVDTTDMPVDKGSWIGWGKHDGVWTDGTNELLFTQGYDGNNETHVKKDSAIPYKVAYRRNVGSGQQGNRIGYQTPLWFFYGITWDDNTGELYQYYYDAVNGFQSVLTNYTGSFVGADYRQSYIGAFQSGGSPWVGWLGPCKVWKSVLTSAQMRSAATIYEIS